MVHREFSYAQFGAAVAAGAVAAAALAAKKWVTGASVAIGADGAHVLRVKTPKKVRIRVVSRAIRSPGVVVAAVKR